MSLAAFALWRYFAVLLFCLAAYVIGAAILRSVRFANRAECVFVCTAFGLGVFSHLILLVGLIHWLTLTGLLVTIGLAVAASSLLLFTRRSSGHGKQIGGQTHQGNWLITALGLLLVAVVVSQTWWLPLYPPTEFDTTMFHLAAPKLWLQAHAITLTPFLRLGIQPHSAHTLFAALMLAAGDIAPQVLSLAAAGLIGIGLYGWGQRVGGQAVGLLAAALWAGSPVVLMVAPVASYHIIASLFAFASIYTLLNYAVTRQCVWLFAAGAFVGFALSTWLWTMLLLPIVSAAALYFAFKERRVQPLWLIAAGLVLAWSPALLRAAWYTGNPTYPLLTGMFGAGPWATPQEISLMATDIHHFGVPRTFPNFLLLPFTLFAHADKFQSPVCYSAIFSLLFPVVVLRVVFDKHLRGLGLAIVVFAGCWFFFGQIMRYLLPIIPLLCLVTGTVVVWLLDWVCRDRQNIRTPVLALVAVAVLWPGLSFAHKERAIRGPIPQTRIQRDAYIAARIPEYRALAVANASPEPLYSLYGMNAAYYYDGLFMGDWFGAADYWQVLASLGDGKTLWNTLHRLCASYFLVYFSGRFVPSIPYDNEFNSYFEPIFADSSSELYRLRESLQAVAARPPNLLRDAGFDELRDNWPIAWGHFGKPVVGTPENGASSGAFAVKVSAADGLVQRVPVTPGDIYELELQAKAEPPQKLFRLQINWLDHKGRVCSVFIRVCEANASWHSYAARMTAPDCAEVAQVYASGHAGNWVWLDSFVFRAVKSQIPEPDSRSR